MVFWIGTYHVIRSENMAKKKIAIFTGASSGLGLEFVKLLLKEDLDEIWMIDRSE